MSRLVKGMFDGANPETALFGLRTAVSRQPDTFVPTAHWFNAAGERLGWGDLSLTDLKRIVAEIREGELFVILNASSGPWDFRELAFAFEVCERSAPGPQYVAEFCILIIAAGVVYLIQPEPECAQVWSLAVLDPLVKLSWSGNFKIDIIPRRVARKLILGHDGSRLGRLVYCLRRFVGK